ncbi:glycosyltransferase family 4 protein [Mucilaginibacter sp. Mucisp84]|uniref:glycosyltransferase family 4 protein n=1 Tax=Mucilaginibacter sp. Mucisp84 TaxID=3243058 RepID=UPI0039A5BBB6
MKIAIISPAFFESTFPLAKYLALNNDITLYCFLNQSLLSPPMLNLKDLAETGLLTDDQVRKCLPSDVKAYFNNSGVSIKVIVCGNSKKVGTLVIWKFIKELRKNNFDKLHFIGEEFRFNFIQYFFPAKKVIQTLHEGDGERLTKRAGKLKTLFIKTFLNRLGNSSIKLIFHSENVRSIFLKNYPRKAKELTTVIPFGLFETYRYITTDSVDLKLPERYFLYYGYIEQYKGLDILSEAIRQVNAVNAKIKFVIAGRDKSGLVNIDGLLNVTFINRFLTEQEIVFMIKNAVAIIMPYKTASQSGIPNTAFCFNVPIIASDIAGLNHVIKHGKNGLLFKPVNVDELVQNILSMNNDKLMVNKLRNEIGENADFEGWETLALKTLDFYEI